MLQQSKLEHLRSDTFSTFSCLLTKALITLLKYVPITLLSNVRLGSKCLDGRNTLAYFCIFSASLMLRHNKLDHLHSDKFLAFSSLTKALLIRHLECMRITVLQNVRLGVNVCKDETL